MLKGHIPDDKIEEIRSKTDIVTLISGHTNLKKAGRNYLGLCPFHKEKTPSFTVSPDKQIFYCFGCGEGGNAVSFIMKINSMTFPEAIRHLASKAGVVIPEKPLTQMDREEIGIREQLVSANRSAATYFTKNLFSAAGKKAWEYLHQRGLKDDAVRAFRLGYAFDGWRYLRDHLHKEKIPLKVAEQAGLLIAKDDGSFYDRFRGRLVFPIEDANGRSIAFGGRLIGEGEPKYLNSPESPVYIKGRNLYGLSITKEEIRKKGFVIVVEGYFDLISLWNVGVTNVVATLGTALTQEHVDLIRRYTTHAAVVFDPDEAGRKALARSLALFLSGNVHMKAVVLPEGYDPDDFARTFGPEKFAELVDKAEPAVEYYIDTVLGARGNLAHDRDLLKDTVTFIAQIQNVVEKNLFVKRIAERIGVDEDVLKKEVSKAATSGRGPEASVRTVRADRDIHLDTVELSLIQMILSYPAKIEALEKTNVLSYFATERLKSLGEEIKGLYMTEGMIDAASIVDQLTEHSLKKRLLSQMVDEGIREIATLEREFTDTVIKIKKKWYKEKRRLLGLQLRQAQERKDSALCDELLQATTKLLDEEKHL